MSKALIYTANTSGAVMDLNQGAGGKYLYLHYKRYSATVTINYYHLNDAGKVVVTKVSKTVSNHLEEMKEKPNVPGLVTYDEKPLRRIAWREDPSIENQGTSLVSSPSATVATSGKNYYATYGFLTDTLAIFPDTIIRFDANGGSGSMSDTTVVYGTSTALRANSFTRNGWSFAGWYAYRTSDNKWYYTNGSDSAWYTEGSQPSGYYKDTYNDGVSVAKTRMATEELYKLKKVRPAKAVTQ